MSQQKKRKFGIRQEILLSFVIVCVIALGSIAITAAIFNEIIGSSIVSADPADQAIIAETLEIELAIIFISLWQIIVISLFVGLKLSDSIVNPIHKLTNIALKLSTHDLKTLSFKEIDTDFDKELEDKDPEFGNLTQAFKKLVKKVKEDAEEKSK
ncbi:MAG: HAMP domain-containing protein [Candidatus Lokiarchaeota archaeon]|nr:HAMP domain-containing protein [Candidatus Lokiarchaeota archaeon]